MYEIQVENRVSGLVGWVGVELPGDGIRLSLRTDRPTIFKSRAKAEAAAFLMSLVQSQKHLCFFLVPLEPPVDE